jgi:hypothetical protein
LSALYGEKNINTRMTNADVKRIWKLIQLGIPYTVIAKSYDCCATASAIGRIGRGETWTAITKLTEKSYRKGGPKND